MRIALFFVLIAAIAAAQTSPANLGATPGLLAAGSIATVNFSSPASSIPASATVSILPAASTTPIPAQVLSVAPFTITFVVPLNTPSGDAEVIYKPGNQATQWSRISIVPASLSLFGTAPAGPLLAQNIQPDGTATLNGLATPAQPGQAVVLWGTGLGATPQSAIGVTLGGVAQTVLYAGAAPGQPGLNQINFQIAPGTPDGCYVPLTIAYGTRALISFLSKTSDGLPCRHPFDFSLDAMKLLDSGGSIQTAELTLSTAIQAPSSDRASYAENAQVLFPSLAAADMAAFFTFPNPTQSCSTSSGSSGTIFASLFDPAAIGPSTLNNGASTLTLPWASPPSPDSPLSALPPPVLAGGKWTWTVSAGTVFPTSSLGFTLPPPVQISGGAPLTFDRTRNQTVSWDGSGFDSAATARLSLIASYPGTPILSCTVPAQAGTITLPSNLLVQFNAGAIGSLSLSVSENGPGLPDSQFNASAGSPLLMIVRWAASDSRPVDFK
ncbi:MAG TPA: hypothetical protein VHZ74_01925 [Bryobacteraceae bacterium]|nr:hypothetical protein [Bryobacteraceae bacterium]